MCACRQVPLGEDFEKGRVVDTWVGEALCVAVERRDLASHDWMSRCLWLHHAGCG